MKRVSTCIHFTGAMQNDCCRVGVNYRQLAGGGEFGHILRLPCVEITNRRGHPVSSCSHRLEPTPEQVAAMEAQDKADIERYRKVMPLVSEWRVTPRDQRQDVIDCPVCNGKLHLSQSSYNGHVHGLCETDGCVRWME